MRYSIESSDNLPESTPEKPQVGEEPHTFEQAIESTTEVPIESPDLQDESMPEINPEPIVKKK